ncbi:MAG: radical SAM protein [Clostridia bacterium]
MLLIYPPVVRSTEPPLGIARLAGFLRSRGQPVRLLDLNHEGLEYLLASVSPYPGMAEGQSSSRPDSLGPDPRGQTSRGQSRTDTWTRGAIHRKDRNLESLHSIETYQNLPRYSRAVGDLNRVLKTASAPFAAEASLANYSEFNRSPLRREDLLDAAAGYRDSPYFSLFSRRIADELHHQPTGLVGLSINYLSQALPALAILGWLAEVHPELSRIAGGGLITSWLAQGSLAGTDSLGGLLHALIPGRGEDGLSAWLAKGRYSAVKPVWRGASSLDAASLATAGLGAGRGSGRVVNAPARASEPDFDDFSQLAYLSPVGIIPYSFSSGCPWKRCTFCPEKAEGGQYTGLPVNGAMTQLHSLATRYKPGLFHFTDNEIAPLYMRSLAEKSPGIHWYGFARFSKVLLDPGFCRALAASGCRMLQLGLESADQQVLDAMGKGTKLGEIDCILENLAKAGIGIFLYVLFGTPREDLAAARKTRDFLASRAALIDFLNIAIFNLPIASMEARMLATRDFYDGALSLYQDFEHPAGFNRSEVRLFISQELDGDSLIREIIKRSPPVFTSNHAVFFLE